MEIISALKASNLIGLGGAGFPTWQKWQAVKDSPEVKRFVICNLSEGEPGVFKDEYILQNHLPELIAGINLAKETIGAQRTYIFLNDKYKKYLPKIVKETKGKKIEVFIDTGRYLCGEETTLLQTMEGKLRQPRQKPPFPTEAGLYGYPTLINNAETLYRAYLISQGETEIKRFYSLSGDVIDHKRIVEEKVGSKIKEVIPPRYLDKINFVRVSGPSGFFARPEDFEQIASGTGAVEIYGKNRRILEGLINSITFLKDESCGKCTPCREGTYRIAELLNKLIATASLWDRKEILELISTIAKTAEVSSFCPLGSSINRPVASVIENFKQEILGE
ncbi:MAG: NADH-ubiquinone oxidoreductase-F iron-sulfur binding region domain-containing protein [Candidatus Berkelbacteria bacterium]